MGSRKNPEWSTDNQFNELHPVCPYCKTHYGDGDIFDVKNYPEDGGAIMFLKCEKCGEEAELIFDWKKLKPEEDKGI